jgi:hypothetical protein
MRRRKNLLKMDQAEGFESRWMRGKSNRSFVVSRRSFNDFAPMPIKFRANLDGIGRFRWRQGAHAIGKFEQRRLGAGAAGFQRLSSSRKCLPRAITGRSSDAPGTRSSSRARTSRL